MCAKVIPGLPIIHRWGPQPMTSPRKGRLGWVGALIEDAMCEINFCFKFNCDIMLQVHLHGNNEHLLEDLDIRVVYKEERTVGGDLFGISHL